MDFKFFLDFWDYPYRTNRGCIENIRAFESLEDAKIDSIGQYDLPAIYRLGIKGLFILVCYWNRIEWTDKRSQI